MSQSSPISTRKFSIEEWPWFLDWLEDRDITILIDGLSLSFWKDLYQEYNQSGSSRSLDKYNKRFTVWCPTKHRIEFKLRWG